LCSSIDAIAPVAGAVDYCAANAFLDTFANSKWNGGRAVLSSINWDAWQDVGMAVSGEAAARMTELRREYLQSAIRQEEGVEAFKRVLSSGMPQVAVVTHSLTRHIAAILNSTRTPEAAAPLEERHSRPDLGSTFVPANTDVEKRITNIWAEVLGIGEIGIDDNFFEMGGHSLLATGVLSRVRDAFGVSVPLRTIFEAPTIRQLAKHVDTLAWIASDKSSVSDEAGDREEVEL
jgi:acyl carrier protein